MIGLSERQRKWVAAGLTSIAVMVVFTFAVGICWGVLKMVDLAAPALVPVVLGVLLAMFFKPYYGWFLKRFRNPTLAFVAMSLTVLVPMGAILWFVGSMMVEQVSAFVAASPTIVTRASEWCHVRHPGLYAGLVQLGSQVRQFLSVGGVVVGHIEHQSGQLLHGGMLALGCAAAAAAAALVAMVVGMTLAVEMIVGMGMGVTVFVGMGMLVGVRHAIVGMLVGMGMFVAVRATGNVVMVDMHILSPCVFSSIIPKKAVSVNTM